MENGAGFWFFGFLAGVGFTIMVFVVAPEVRRWWLIRKARKNGFVPTVVHGKAPDYVPPELAPSPPSQEDTVSMGRVNYSRNVPGRRPVRRHRPDGR